MTEPTKATEAKASVATQAGRALLDDPPFIASGGGYDGLDERKMRDAIAAIEAEAAEKARAEVLRNEGLGQIIADALADRDAARDGWDALLAQTLAIRPIIDAEIARRDRIAAGDKTAGSMPPAEWDALASLPATANLPARYLDLASPDAERRLAAALATVGGVGRPQPNGAARAILAAVQEWERNAERGWHAGHGRQDAEAPMETEFERGARSERDRLLAGWEDPEATRRDIINDWLASPDAERRLAAAIHQAEDAHLPDVSLRQKDKARAILAALREQPAGEGQ